MRALTRRGGTRRAPRPSLRRPVAATAAAAVGIGLAVTAVASPASAAFMDGLVTYDYPAASVIGDDAVWTVPYTGHPWYPLQRQDLVVDGGDVVLGDPVDVARLCTPAVAEHDGHVAYRRDPDCGLVLRAPDGTETLLSTPEGWASSAAMSADWYADTTVLHDLATGEEWAVADLVVPPPAGWDVWVEDVAVSDALVAWDVVYFPADDYWADVVTSVQVAPLGPGGPGAVVELDEGPVGGDLVLAGIGAAEVAWVRNTPAVVEGGRNGVDTVSVPLGDLTAAPQVRPLDATGQVADWWAGKAWVEDRTVTVAVGRRGPFIGDVLHEVDLASATPPGEGEWFSYVTVLDVRGDLRVVLDEGVPTGSRTMLWDATGRELHRAPAPLVVSDVEPPSGAPEGGTRVRIRGAGFTGATGVTFGGVPGTDLAVVDAATIEVTTPPGTATVPIVVTTASGASGVPLTARFSYTGLVGLMPVRVVDAPAVTPGVPTCVQVAGTHGVPADATGVLVNVTTVRPTGPGHVVLYPDDAGDGSTPVPTASTANFEVGRDVANAATVALPESGRLCYLTRGAASVGVLVDVTGYLLDAAGVVTQSPERLLDTRPGALHVGSVTGPVEPHRVYTVQVAGRAGVPAGATAVLVNATVTGAAAPGNLRVFPGGGDVPDTSVVNYAPGVDKANSTMVPLVDGALSFWSDTFAPASTSPVHVVLDVVGYLTGGSALVAVDPVRIEDTRIWTDPGRLEWLPPREAVSFPVSAIGPVPDDATGVVLNVTAVRPRADGNLRVYPDSDGTGRTPPPGASTLNYIPHRDVANQVVVALPSDGYVTLWSDTFDSHNIPDVAIDVIGYVRATSDR